MIQHSICQRGLVARIRLLTRYHLQVIRWSALAFGVFFGFSHQRTITATQKAAHDQHEWEHKQKLIDQAKAEYAKLKNPAPASKDDGTLDRIRS
jgi:F-type H+-transporting ATP synthase subunit e